MKPTGIELFADLTIFGDDTSGLRDNIAALSAADSLGGFVERATILISESEALDDIPISAGWSVVRGSNHTVSANSALVSARDAGRHLLVLSGAESATNESVGALAEAFSWDDHFGVSVPRHATLSGNVLPIIPELRFAAEAMPRRVLTEVPEFYVLPEFLDSCFLIRHIVLEVLPLLDESSETLSGAFQKYLCRARRTGFRTVVANRVLVSKRHTTSNQKQPVSKRDLKSLHAEYPDAGRAKAEVARDPLHLHEALLGRLFSPDVAQRQSMLLDLRGVPDHMNGTAEAALALCDAIRNLRSSWNITILAEKSSSDYHSLASRYPDWKLIDQLGRDLFTVALRLSQPWKLETQIELHRIALLNIYAMLDTIAWDILFEAPPALSSCWEFMTQYSDGLLYNSNYTRKHVFCRFPLARSTPALVYHHSFSPDDYVVPALRTGGSEGYWFVIGNNYEHKALTSTVDLLVSSFPFKKLRVLGLKSHPSSQVETVESGRVPAADIERLFSGADLVIFPSLYEGFGLPVIRGLSYGRTVIARQSDLLIELAGLYRGPGRLIPFSSAYELVDAIGRVIYGAEIPELPLGTVLDVNKSEPLNWGSIGENVLNFVSTRMQRKREFRWLSRQRAVGYLQAYPS